ncbi:hypothetical protein [Devosia nitrariae]|uniref:DUF1127 domain-containing protein n=1 Tax=Devosia nitrariae TaxID=2071872 RepID=A0ABQ5W261_9HYPH|nr:hypothetical protein [Devosia nitrariae]GLQ53977.1 hypothetical protein GCM10010862_12360 [Devosia nitrariae]
MSTNHAIADACNEVVLTSARTFAIPSPRHFALAGLARLAAVLRRRKLQAFAAYPDHLLADMGYGRDWDGSIVPLVNDPKGWS